MNGSTDSHSPPRLSKSRVVAGWKCPRYLWWKVHNKDAPELQPSVADQDRMDQGKRIGRLATERFPGGVEIEYAPDELDRMARETRAPLDAGAPAIYEASFFEDGVFVAVDILERLDPGQSTEAFRLIEVKATSSLKDEHIPDAGVQLHVLRKAGIDVREVALMHLNKGYRHPGPDDLFVLNDITEQAEAFQPEIPALLDFCRAALSGDDPGPIIGEQCTRFECPLLNTCWPTEPDHIRNLNGVGLKTALKHMEAGVHSFGDLPADARISDKARRQLQSIQSGELKLEPTLTSDLQRFRGHLGFLDFETIMRAEPPWDGLAPYAGYEKRCIKALKEAVPELEPELDELLSRLLDLEKVVGRNLAHPDFKGKTSIKYVLTPLVPELTYEGMDVADGMTASVRLARLILEPDTFSEEAREAERRALLEYCKLDTLAMVRLLERLEGLVGGES